MIDGSRIGCGGLFREVAQPDGFGSLPGLAQAEAERDASSDKERSSDHGTGRHGTSRPIPASSGDHQDRCVFGIRGRGRHPLIGMPDGTDRCTAWARANGDSDDEGAGGRQPKSSES
jgi:hypothetical protein